MAVCAAVMAGAAGGMFVMMKRVPPAGPAAAGGAAAPAAAEAAPEEPPKAEEEGGEGAGPSVITLAPFVVNLEDENGETHFLKMTVAVELNGGKWSKYFEHQTPKVRNSVVLLLSNLKISQTQGQANKRKLVEDLKVAISEAVGKHAVKEIFLTEFVIQ